jgi:hypothetical protein
MIDGSCYREGRDWKLFVISGLHCFFFLTVSFPFPQIQHSPFRSNSGERVHGTQKKHRKTKTQGRLEAVSCLLSIRHGVSCMSFSSLFSFLSYTHPLSSHLSISSDPIFSFFPFSYCLSVIFFLKHPASFYRAQRVSSGLLVCHIILSILV